jgi:sec-independent protein translocase protein TatB
MFDFAWSEIGLIGLVAVVVLGPKELPQAMRALGRFTRQARKLANEFQGHVNELVRESELDDVRTSVQRISAGNVGAEIDKLLDPDAKLSAELDAALSKARETVSASPDSAEATAAPAPAAEPPAVLEAATGAAIPPPLPPATPVAAPAQHAIPAEPVPPEAAP